AGREGRRKHGPLGYAVTRGWRSGFRRRPKHHPPPPEHAPPPANAARRGPSLRGPGPEEALTPEAERPAPAGLAQPRSREVADCFVALARKSFSLALQTAPSPRQSAARPLGPVCVIYTVYIAIGGRARTSTSRAAGSVLLAIVLIKYLPAVNEGVNSAPKSFPLEKIPVAPWPR